MRQLSVAFLMVLGWVTLCEGRSLRVEWPLYQATMPVNKLVLFRNTNGGIFNPLPPVISPTQTTYTDGAVQKNRTYCYKLAAYTATGTASALSEQGCGRPRR